MERDSIPETTAGNGAIMLHDMSGCLVTRKPDSTVTKIGRRVNLDERPALELAAQYGLPVPRVYDAGPGPINGEAFIRMEFIDGERLDLVWDKLNIEEKFSIFFQLRKILTTMRSIPSKTGQIASCSGGVVRDCRQFDEYTGGPFMDEATFNTSFYIDLLAGTPRVMHMALSEQLRSDHRIVFSHGDLSQHNIMVKDGQITGLLDWEYAGWYPEYWDYVKFFDRPCSHKDWKECVDVIFPQANHQELVYHQSILLWQRP